MYKCINKYVLVKLFVIFSVGFRMHIILEENKHIDRVPIFIVSIKKIYNLCYVYYRFPVLAYNYQNATFNKSE